MARYQNHRDGECQECKELVAVTANNINSICLKDPEKCCFDLDYGISFPSDPYEFAQTYKEILFQINSSDSKESSQSRNTWNKCVKPNIESLQLCKNKGKCAEIPTNPSDDHNLMAEWCEKKFPVDKDQTSCWQCFEENSPCEWSELESICTNLKNCKNNNLLDALNPPSGKLKICLDKLASGQCNPIDQSTEGMTARSKQYYWEERSDGNATSTPTPTSIKFHSCCDSSIPEFCGEGIPKCRNVRVPRSGVFRKNPCWAHETYKAGPCKVSKGRRCCDSSLPGWNETSEL